MCRPINLPPFIGIEKVEPFVVFLKGECGIEGNMSLTFFGSLGGDDDNTVGCLRTIN